MNILALGCDSFIVKNLFSYSMANKDLKIFNYKSINQFKKNLKIMNLIIINSGNSKYKKNFFFDIILNICKKIKKENNSIPIIFLSDYSKKKFQVYK